MEIPAICDFQKGICFLHPPHTIRPAGPVHIPGDRAHPGTQLAATPTKHYWPPWPCGSQEFLSSVLSETTGEAAGPVRREIPGIVSVMDTSLLITYHSCFLFFFFVFFPFFLFSTGKALSGRSELSPLNEQQVPPRLPGLSLRYTSVG